MKDLVKRLRHIIGLSTLSSGQEGGGEREEGGGHPFAPPNRPRFARPSIPVSVITANLRFPTKYLPYMNFTSPRP